MTVIVTFFKVLKCRGGLHLLDHLLVVGDAHLRRILSEYVSYFNRSRPHQGIDQHVPEGDESPSPSGGDTGEVTACTQRGPGSEWPAS